VIGRVLRLLSKKVSLKNNIERTEIVFKTRLKEIIWIRKLIRSKRRVEINKRRTPKS